MPLLISLLSKFYAKNTQVSTGLTTGEFSMFAMILVDKSFMDNGGGGQDGSNNVGTAQ